MSATSSFTTSRKSEHISEKPKRTRRAKRGKSEGGLNRPKAWVLDREIYV